MSQAEQLMQVAKEAREHAYAPYSRFHVGSAVLDADGTISPGCNVENAGFSPTICAERVALTGAFARGHQNPVAIAVMTDPGVTPCGVCRQVMLELGPDMTVYIGDGEGNIRSTTVRELLPGSFSKDDLTFPIPK